MTKQVLLTDIMNRKLLTLHPKDKIESAKQIFMKWKIHHIPVVVGRQLVGILSQGDILFFNKWMKKNQDKFMQNMNITNLSTIEEVMTSNPFALQSNSGLIEALDFMLSKRVNCVPVVEGQDLVGLITTHDLLKYLKTELEEKYRE